MLDILKDIQDDLNQAIASDSLALPVLPEVALSIRDGALDPEITASELVALISRDPSVAGRLIQVANSSQYRGTKPTAHLPMAVERLGTQKARTTASAYVERQVFDTSLSRVEDVFREVWKQATDVAGLAAVNAKYFTNLEPDQAALAGLTHNIGVLPILKWASQDQRLLENKELLDWVIDKLHSKLGLRLLEAWEFPEEIQTVASNYLQFDFDCEDTTLTDVVQVAYFQCVKGSDHPHAATDCSKLRSFQKLGLGDTEAQAQDLSEQMAAATQALYN